MLVVGVGKALTVKLGTYLPLHEISRRLLSFVMVTLPGAETNQRPLPFLRVQLATNCFSAQNKRTLTSCLSSSKRVAQPLNRLAKPTAKASLRSLKYFCVGITMAGFLKCLKCYWSRRESSGDVLS